MLRIEQGFLRTDEGVWINLRHILQLQVNAGEHINPSTGKFDWFIELQQIDPISKEIICTPINENFSIFDSQEEAQQALDQVLRG